MKRGTTEHPKTVRLSRILDIERWGAIGLLEGLWHFAARYAIQGDIGRWSNQEIADGIGWHGRHGTPDALVAALVEARFLDESPEHRLLIHDWADHCDESVRKTLKSRGLSVLVRDDSRKVEKGSDDSGRVGPAFPFLSSPSPASPSPASPSPASPSPASPSPPERNAAVAAADVDGLKKKLRGDPFRLRYAARAVDAAMRRGVKTAEIVAMAGFWEKSGAQENGRPAPWNRSDLYERIFNAMPGENPTEHWPPPGDWQKRKAKE
jgi:hypothetical protein